MRPADIVSVIEMNAPPSQLLQVAWTARWALIAGLDNTGFGAFMAGYGRA